MGEWVIGAVINLFGSLAINFGTNLLKLGHNEVGRDLFLLLVYIVYLSTLHLWLLLLFSVENVSYPHFLKDAMQTCYKIRAFVAGVDVSSIIKYKYLSFQKKKKSISLFRSCVPLPLINLTCNSQLQNFITSWNCLNYTWFVHHFLSEVCSGYLGFKSSSWYHYYMCYGS